MEGPRTLVLRGVAHTAPGRPRPRLLDEGALLAGRFRIQRLAGWGGMGAVYRALDGEGGTPVAIKIIHAAGAHRVRFEQEARLLAALAHPAIVGHVAHGVHDDGQLYLVMEWLEGEDLARRLARAALEPAAAVALAAAVAGGLGAAHAAGIVHRDVKPSNLMLVGGDPQRTKLLDFGLARPRAGAAVLTRAGAVLGTSGYMAPEQASGARDVDPRADVFALGCVLFECLTGQPAFAGARAIATLAKVMRQEPPRLRMLRPGLPASLDDLVARMLAKRRDDRPADGGAVAAELSEMSEMSGPGLATAEKAADAAGADEADAVGASLLLVDRVDPARAAEVGRGFDAEAAVVGDAAVMMTLPPAGSAAERAARAAALALALRASEPDARIAVATIDGGADSAGTALGVAIDRAATLLGDDGAGGAVAIDESTARLLGDRFDVGDPPGWAGPPPSSPPGLAVVDRARYRIEREIARGGMGRILLAEDLRLGRRVALKELLGWSPDLVRRFEREVMITARLQHPAIVSVHEAGRWSSGEPFFAMRMVPGRSLEAAIAEARRPDERLALLPHAVAAVEALAYAHSQRVIHRDLKPGNVLVGEFGETVVIDWGLAKDLAQPISSADGERAPWEAAPAGRADSITVVGDVLGTPAYMAPEQAAGGDVDERSDVYAIGAILYHLLAGAPPYAGADVTDVIAHIRAAPPPPLARIAPWAPRDLLALVAKAMDPDPERRYPSAVELAEDLVRFQTGRLVAAHRYSVPELIRRFVRRNRAAVGVAVLLVALLAGLSGYGVRRIVAERDTAREQREAAERLVSFVLVDLRARLDELGKLDLLGGVAGEIASYYRALGAQPEHGDAALLRQADALELLGDVLHMQGDPDGATARLRDSLRLREGLLARHPGRAEYARLVAKGHVHLAITLKPHDRAAATAELDAAERVLAPVAADPESGAELASVLLELGEQAEDRGDVGRAIALYRRAVALREAAVAAGGSTNNRFLLSKAQIWLGDALTLSGDAAGALALFEQARDIRLALVAEEPQIDDWRRGLGYARGRLTDAYAERGDLDRAQREQEEAVAIARAMTERDATDTGYRSGLGIALVKLGNLERRRGDLDAAARHVGEGFELATALAAGEPDNTARQFNLADAHRKLALLARARGDARQALAEARAGTALVEALVGKDPQGGWEATYCVFLDDVGEALALGGDPAAALAQYRTNAACLERAIVRDASVGLRSLLGRTLAKAADLRGRQPDGAGEAAALRGRALDLLRALAAEGRLDALGRTALGVLERGAP